MTTVTDYEKQATDLLAKFGVTFRVERIGTDCPIFCEDAEKQRDMDKVTTFPRRTHIHGAHHRAFFTRDNAPEPCKHRQFSVDFWNSYADEEQNHFCTGGRNLPSLAVNYQMLDKYKGKRGTKVSAYNVLTSIQKYDVGTFENFCGDFGYDRDSRKAERVYNAVLTEWSKVASFFSAEELEQLQEVQ